jgi:hypothetical protein
MCTQGDQILIYIHTSEISKLQIQVSKAEVVAWNLEQ